MNKVQLILEDGTVFHGERFGHHGHTKGEVVFNTSMTGYQEVLTDPAYYGQMVMLTNPSIGNYGINRDDFETIAPFIRGLIVKEICHHPSNFRSDESLDSFLKAHEISGISGIDTRQLMRHIRTHGTMNGYITSAHDPIGVTVEKLKEIPEENVVHHTSTVKPYVVPGRGKRIVLVDLGMKHGIMRELTKRDCHVTVVPYNYSATNILRLKPDGILLSSGPGNPMLVSETIQMVKDIVNKVPLFGIGLGHQIFALACGASTEKLKTGHRGTSYPVKNIEHNQTVMTAQNHSFVVTNESLTNTDLQVTHINLHDETIAGLKHSSYKAFSVQFYPEGSPGPEDSIDIFDHFLQAIKSITMTSEEETNV